MRSSRADCVHGGNGAAWHPQDVGGGRPSASVGVGINELILDSGTWFLKAMDAVFYLKPARTRASSERCILADGKTPRREFLHGGALTAAPAARRCSCREPGGGDA